MGAKSTNKDYLRGFGFNKILDGKLFSFSSTGKTGGANRNNFLASGGNIDALAPGNGYKYHTFTSPGNFVVTSPSITVEILIVGGGGGGGGYLGGGGGAGGLVYVNSFSLSSGTYPVVIGAGGAGAPAASGGSQGTSGSNSSFDGLTANGGGGGRSYNSPSSPSDNGTPGGSGSGAALVWYPPGIGGTPNTGTATQPTQPQPANWPAPSYVQYGNIGGGSYYNDPGYYGGGGGGGAGDIGGTASQTPTSNPTNKGGIGRQYPQFAGNLIGLSNLSVQYGYFAGGGGGGHAEQYTSRAAGGLGGGGRGGNGTYAPLPTGGENGYFGSGGGGGATGRNPSGPPYQAGGNGGNGIVVIRYAA